MFSLLTVLHLANVRILLALNDVAGLSPRVFKLFLLLTDKGADAITGATILLLWFWPEHRAKRIFGSYQSKARLTGWYPIKAGRIVDRDQSRAQALVLGTASLGGYVMARLLAMMLDVDRPFATFLPLHSLPGAYEGLRTYASFPSDHAVLLGALPVGLLFWNRPLAWGWMALSVLLVLTRIAVGFHYPADMLAGLLMGVGIASVAMCTYSRGGRLERSSLFLARAFRLESSPYCFFLYLFLALAAVEFAMHFQHVLGLLYQIRGEILTRMR